MADQNSVVVPQIRPEALMDELNIKKDAYYAYLKHLNLKAEKDHDGKAYLTEEQANLVRALRSHVEQTGKMEGFVNSNGELAIVSESLLETAQASESQGDRLDDQLDDLIRAAAELKGQQLVMPQLVIRELANRMSYEDLPSDVQQRVDRAREEITRPKAKPGELAEQLLSRWRTNQTGQAA